jgi:hypothetical protein
VYHARPDSCPPAAQTHPGQVDHVGVDPGGRFVSYQAGAGSTPYEATLLAAPGAGGARGSASSPTLSEHVVKVGATSGGSGSERLSFRGGREFTLDHAGPSGTASLTLSAFGKNGQPVAVRLPKLRVGHGEEVGVSPQSWKALGSRPIRIRTKVGGRTGTRLVKGHRLGRAFATVKGAKLRAGKGGLTLKLRVRHPSGDDWVSPAVKVLRGGHAVARSAPHPAHRAGAAEGHRPPKTESVAAPQRLCPAHPAARGQRRRPGAGVDDRREGPQDHGEMSAAARYSPISSIR